MSDLKSCPFHNCNTCGCNASVDIPDKDWNYRPIEDKLKEQLKAANEDAFVLARALENYNLAKINPAYIDGILEDHRARIAGGEDRNPNIPIVGSDATGPTGPTGYIEY